MEKETKSNELDNNRLIHNNTTNNQEDFITKGLTDTSFLMLFYVSAAASGLTFHLRTDVSEGLYRRSHNSAAIAKCQELLGGSEVQTFAARLPFLSIATFA